MPKQTKQGTRSRRAVAKPQAVAPAASRPALYLETMAGCGDFTRPAGQFNRDWACLKKAIEGDIQRIRAHATANYDEKTRRRLEVCAIDAASQIESIDNLMAFVEAPLMGIEAALESAQEAVEQAERKMKKGRSRKGSKRSH